MNAYQATASYKGTAFDPEESWIKDEQIFGDRVSQSRLRVVPKIRVWIRKNGPFGPFDEDDFFSIAVCTLWKKRCQIGKVFCLDQLLLQIAMNAGHDLLRKEKKLRWVAFPVDRIVEFRETVDSDRLDNELRKLATVLKGFTKLDRQIVLDWVGKSPCNPSYVVARWTDALTIESGLSRSHIRVRRKRLCETIKKSLLENTGG